jgi:hypothetical protein
MKTTPTVLKPIWLVWAPSRCVPGQTHATEKSAMQEAARLSAKQPNEGFHVLKSRGYWQVVTPDPKFNKAT